MGKTREGEEWVDAKVVAAYLGVTQAYVLKLALLGKIPASPLPTTNDRGRRHRWRFRLSDIQAWMETRQEALPNTARGRRIRA